jgi:glycosyltransferase involved in cell wall biosynthesis
MLSKACIVGAYQRKLEEIAALPGVDLTVLVPPYWQENGRRTELEPAHTLGYDLRVLPMACNGQFHLHYYPTLGEHLRRLRPDVCHIDEEPYNLATFLALRAARGVGARSLFFTWQNLARRYPAPFRWLEGWVLGHSDYALAGSHEAEEVLRGKGYTGPVAVIPQFGVDPDIFQPAATPPAAPFTFGFAGRFVPGKGLHVLLHALAGVRGDWRLLLVGSGPEREPLQTLATQLGIGERVTFEAPMPSVAMPRFYQGLHACVLPSLTLPNWKEQFGRVLIEAMACGVAVVGSASGEIPIVIGEAGLTFPEGNAGALQTQLQRLLDEPRLVQDLAVRGRERVLAQYTQRQIARQTVEVYERMVET